jgi:hypothetical protein
MTVYPMTGFREQGVTNAYASVASMAEPLPGASLIKSPLNSILTRKELIIKEHCR